MHFYTKKLLTSLKEQQKERTTLDYFLCKAIIRGAQRVAAHSCKAAAFLCRAIKMD